MDNEGVASPQFNFPLSIFNLKKAFKVLLSLCETVAFRLRKQGFSTRLIGIGLKNSRFEYVSRQKTIDNPVDSLSEIYNITKELFDELWKGEPLRALGVRLSMLSSSENMQQFLFTPKTISKLRELDIASDKVRKKYGKGIITRAAILDYCNNSLPTNEEVRGMATRF